MESVCHNFYDLIEMTAMNSIEGGGAMNVKCNTSCRSRLVVVLVL